MPRGAAQQENLQNKTAATYQGQGAQAFNAEMPVLQNQLNNPGFDPVTAAAIRRSGVDTANSAFDAAKFSAAQRAGATGNDAMFYASADKIAQDKAAADSTAATNAEVTIGKQKLDSQQQAIQDASQLYSFANNAGDARAGYATTAMGDRASAVQNFGGVVDPVANLMKAGKA